MPLDAKKDFAVCSPPSGRTSEQATYRDVLGRRQRSPKSSPTPPRPRRQHTTTMTVISAMLAASLVVRLYRATKPCRSLRRAVVVVVGVQFDVKESSASAVCTAAASSNCKVTAAAPRATDGHSPFFLYTISNSLSNECGQVNTAFLCLPRQHSLLPFRCGCTLHGSRF